MDSYVLIGTKQNREREGESGKGKEGGQEKKQKQKIQRITATANKRCVIKRQSLPLSLREHRMHA